MARHRLTARHTRIAHPLTAIPPGRHDVPANGVLPLDRAPAHLRAAIQRYWADGLDAHAIAERLAGQGVTVHDVLVERYLNPS